MMANGPGHPRPPDGGSAGRGDDALQRATFALNNQRPDEAERLAGEMLKAEPRHAKALQIFGCALLMQGRGQEAIAPLETAARGRHDPEIDTQLAIALRQAGRPEEALSRLKRATKRQPPLGRHSSELGSLLVSMERYDEAIEVLSRGLEVAPMVPELSIQLGYIFLLRRNCTDAKVAFARALNYFPWFPRRAVRHGEGASGDRREPGGSRLVSALSEDQAERCGHLAQSRPLSPGARRARRRLRCFRTAARG